uniref:Uncharacterized protein n=1 Tax=Arundo donax TaxID=35708 RepID=A0A0A9GCY9_ARUDO
MGSLVEYQELCVGDLIGRRLAWGSPCQTCEGGARRRGPLLAGREGVMLVRSGPTIVQYGSGFSAAPLRMTEAAAQLLHLTQDDAMLALDSLLQEEQVLEDVTGSATGTWCAYTSAKKVVCSREVYALRRAPMSSISTSGVVASGRRAVERPSICQHR